MKKRIIIENIVKNNNFKDIFVIRKWHLYSCFNTEKEGFGAETKFYKSFDSPGNNK